MATLTQFPSKIDDIYTKTLQRIAQSGRERVANIVLLWTVFAKRNLSMELLLRVVVLDPETHIYAQERQVPEHIIVSVCLGLVAVDAKTRLLRLIRR